MQAFARQRGVQFPLFAKTDVNGAGAHPVFKELKAAMRSEGGDADIEWNFVRCPPILPALGQVLKADKTPLSAAV